MDEIVFPVVPDAKAFFRHTGAQQFLRILVQSCPPLAELSGRIHPDLPVAKKVEHRLEADERPICGGCGKPFQL